SWLYLSLHLAALAVSHLLLPGLPSSHGGVLLATGLAQVAGYLQIVHLLFGTWAFALERRLSPRLERVIPLLAVAAGIFTTFLYAGDPGAADLRHFLRVGLRATLAAAGFLASAVAVWRRLKPGPELGPRLVALALLLYGLEHLHDAAVSLQWLLTGSPAPEGLALAYADFVVLLVMGVGMVTCLLEAERSAAERAVGQAEHLAYYDPLTELPNRQLFRDRLSVALARAHREGRKVAVFCLNLDRFKFINDSLGHTVGDWVLHEAGRRVQATVRQGDTLARFGGDEFALIVSGLRQTEEAGKIALKILAAIQPPFQLEGRELFVTMSAGVSLFPEDGATEEVLLRNAGTALHRAKDKGRDTFQLYAPAMNETAVERLTLEAALRRAVPRDELVLHYQPIVEVASGRIVGAEALLRWQHPERGLLFPKDFIELAESTGLITSFGPWILKAACTQARAWQERCPGLCMA
ncbi:MAG: putative bifunctional diguanylate cyclase/phosphodiesterase, partial [Candidatus Methylomirabilales bacterium]